MKKKKKLPTILGVLILLIGVVAGVLLINSRQVFKIGADVDSRPKNVRVSNVTESTATITWTTDVKSQGFVKWGKSETLLSKVALEEGQDKNYVHSAILMGAETNSTVFFKINSDSNDYDNEGIAWQTKTLATKHTQTGNLIASGIVLESNSSTPAVSLVYLTINGTLLSTLTSNEGNFIIPLSTYIDNISDTTTIEIVAQGGLLGSAQAIIYPKSIKFIPTIILGKSYDFRSLPETNDSDLPQSSLSIPESVNISSRFEITKSEQQQKITEIKIDSIDEGEIITTTTPEFFGTGPINHDIEITVESELQTGNVKVQSNGKWKWSPPDNLEPGEHKLTLKWRDSTGILRTITRTFIVNAAEGPAFEATPSATPSIKPSTTPQSSSSPTPMSTSSATPNSFATPKVTAPPTPETGSLTPTLGLFIMGIGILMSSVFVWNKQY